MPLRNIGTCYKNSIHLAVCMYRFMKEQLEYMTFLSAEFDEGNVCPACPKVRLLDKGQL